MLVKFQELENSNNWLRKIVVSIPFILGGPNKLETKKRNVKYLAVF